MGLKAKQRAGDIVRGLNALSPHERHNVSILKRFREKALALIQFDPVGGNLVLGAISTLEKKIDDMHRYHRQALYYGKPAVGYLNYAVSLSKFGDFSESAKYAMQAYEMNRKDPDILCFLIESTLLAGRIRAAANLLRNQHKSLDIRDPHLPRTLGKAASILNTENIPDADAESLQRLVSTLLRRWNIHIHDMRCRIKSFLGLDFIHFEFEIDDDPEAVAELESELEYNLGHIPENVTHTIQIEFIPTLFPAHRN